MWWPKCFFLPPSLGLFLPFQCGYFWTIVSQSNSWHSSELFLPFLERRNRCDDQSVSFFTPSLELLLPFLKRRHRCDDQSVSFFIPSLDLFLPFLKRRNRCDDQSVSFFTLLWGYFFLSNVGTFEPWWVNRIVGLTLLLKGLFYP